MGAVKPSKKQRGKQKAAASKTKASESNNKHVKFNEDGEVAAPKTAMLKKKRARAAPSKDEKKEAGGKSDRSPEMIQSAKYYLEQWKKRNEPKADGELPWKFKKVKQMWILHWMYEADVVPKSMFALVLEYLNGIQGAARQRVLESAHKIIDVGEPAKPENENDEQDVTVKLARRRFKRALQVAELLS